MKKSNVARRHRAIVRALSVGLAFASACTDGSNSDLGSDGDPERAPIAADPASELGPVPDELTSEAAPPPGPDRFPHHADAPEVSVFWADPPDGIEAASTLTLVAQSHTDDARLVVPRVFVSGLDDRTAEVELEAFELAAGDRQDITVHLADLPVQGVSHSVQLLASGTFEGPDTEPVTVQADPLAFHFSDDYAQAYVYTLDTMVLDLQGGRVAADERELAGRVFDAGSFAPVHATPDVLPDGIATIEYTHEIAPVAGLESPTSLGATLPTQSAPGSGDPGDTDPGNNPPPLQCLFSPWNCCTGANCLDVCADWSTTYLDASPVDAASKEDHGLGAGTQTIDASYAEFTITRTTCSGLLCFTSTITSGLLGPDGCAEVDLAPGSGYSLKVKTKLHNGTGSNTYPVEHHPSNDAASNQGVVQVAKSFTAYGNQTPLPPPMLTLPFHQAGNAAATVSRALASGVVVDQPSGFTILSGLGCGASPGIPPTDACAGTSLKTGPYTNPDNTPGDLRWKFILAHEFGHVMQGKAMGSLSNPYCFTTGGGSTFDCAAPNLPDHPQAPASCACAFVTGSNALHCLQSYENGPAAQIEGFAQFFAARVWNNPDASCLFRYYKQFREDNGTVVQPPVNKACATWVNWRDNHCYGSWGGTEYDWMVFLWNLHAVGSYKFSMHDIFEVYRGACTDEFCNSEGPNWAALEASAEAYFGPGSDKWAKFVLAGTAAGVDDSEF
jgi:hypothetical protein